MVTVQVPQEPDAQPGDGPPETAPNCEALTPKAKATAGGPSRTPVHVWRGVSEEVGAYVLHSKVKVVPSPDKDGNSHFTLLCLRVSAI